MTTKTFTFSPMANIWAVEIDGAWWFVAADVFRALGLTRNKTGGYSQHLAGLSADAKRVETASYLGVHGLCLVTSSGGMNAGTKITMTSESGLYRLIMRCEKPVAATFQT